MDKFDLTARMNKRGLIANGALASLVGILIVAILMGALGPEIFTNLNVTGAPTWVNTTLPVIAGAGFVMMLWRIFN